MTIGLHGDGGDFVGYLLPSQGHRRILSSSTGILSNVGNIIHFTCTRGSPMLSRFFRDSEAA
jgi:hypothetical protein